MPKIKILNEDKTYEAIQGTSLLEFCLENQTSVPFGCMAGACGTCRIRVVENPDGLAPMEDIERDFLRDFVPEALPQDRLACQCTIADDVTFEVVDTGQHNYPGAKRDPKKD